MDKSTPVLMDRKAILFYVILGIIIGYFWGHEPEKPPYEIRLDGGHIEIVQESGSDYVYTFSHMGEGYYEHSFTGKRQRKNKGGD